MEFAAGLWACPTCHHAYSNDDARDVLAPADAPKGREPPFSAWRDEQARIATLIRGHRGHSEGKSGRFGGRKKPSMLRRDLWSM